MNNGLLSIKKKKNYTDAEVEMARWKTDRLFELGLISDPYEGGETIYNNINNNDNLMQELIDLEHDARVCIDNYTEVPDEIKNRIFELRKILWG